MSNSDVKNVLIVDDEPDLREVIEFDFDQAGYDILMAGDGLEASEVLQKHPEIRAVVSDIVMPKMNGIELLQKVRATSRSPIFVFVTGYSSYDGSEIYNLGGNALVRKPFRRQVLVDLCERLLLPEEKRWSPDPTKIKAEKQLQHSWSSLDEAQTKNRFALGRGGFALHVTESFKLDSPVQFQFQFGAQQMAGFAIVRWVHGENVGFEFLYLDPSSIKIWLPQILAVPGNCVIKKNF